MLSSPSLIVGAKFADDERATRSKQRGSLAQDALGIRGVMEHHIGDYCVCAQFALYELVGTTVHELNIRQLRSVVLS